MTEKSSKIGNKEVSVSSVSKGVAGDGGKKAYRQPQLTDYGDVAKQTQGLGAGTNDGFGPRFA